MPSRSQAQQRSGVFQVKFNETPLILAVEPHMVTSRTNQQVGISVVRAIKVYVVNNFTAFHRATERLLCYFYVNRLWPCALAAWTRYASRPVHVAPESNPYVGFISHLVPAGIAMFGHEMFQRAALWARRQHLAILVSWQAAQFRFCISWFLALLEACCFASAEEVISPVRIGPAGMGFLRAGMAMLCERGLHRSAFTDGIFARHDLILLRGGGVYAR